MRSTEYEKWIDGQLSMMKNSSLLKWTNNKNHKNKNGNKNWIHPPETLQGGHIVYLVKFLGSTEVSQPKGIEVVKEAITKLRFNQQIKKTEGAKTPKVELTISVDGVAIQQPKSKKIISQYPLHQISYCADDKAEKRFFSFIAKEADREAHTCFVFISDKLAEEITLTIGQAFDLAYRKFLETSNREGELKRQLSCLRQQVQTMQKEKSSLEERLRQVAALKDREDLNRYMEENGISDLLFVNGVQSTEEPIIHNTNHCSSDKSTYESIQSLALPPVPPRNSPKTDALDDLESGEDDFDFDPRAEEKKKSPPSPTSVHRNGNNVIGNGSTSPDSNGFGSDDDFDPRAEESDKKIFGMESSFDIKSPSLELNGVSNFPTLVPPPPRPTRQQDKLIPTHLLEGENDPFSSPPQDLFSQFDQMKIGFSRGLSFGTADNDFTLESLDPLKN